MNWTLDLASHKLAAVLTLSHDWDLPRKPHAAPLFDLKVARLSMHQPQLPNLQLKYKDDAEPYLRSNTTCRCFYEFETKAHEVSDLLASIANGVEQAVLTKPVGMSSDLQVKFASLSTPLSLAVWRTEASAFWFQLRWNLNHRSAHVGTLQGLCSDHWQGSMMVNRSFRLYSHPT